MKKLLALITSTFICVSSMFAYTNIITLGVKGAVPAKITGSTYSESETANFSFNATGINVGYIGCFDNGFTFKDSTSLGFGTAKTTSLTASGLTFFNTGITELVGLGYSFINTPNLFVALYGNIGTDVNIAVTSYVRSDKTYTTTIISPAFLIGGDLTFVFTPKKVFSLYASFSANAGFSVIPVATLYTSTNDAGTSYNREFISTAFFQLVPTVGISWKF